MTSFDLNKTGIDIIEQISNFRLYNVGKEQLEKSFLEFRRNTKLLQYIYYFSKLESKKESERSLEVIDGYIGDEWFKRINNDNTIAKDNSKAAFESIFKKFRTSRDGLAAQEFVKAFMKLKEIKDQKSGTGELISANIPFTDNEFDDYYLLVLDGEMSFFSLLLILSNAVRYCADNDVNIDHWVDHNEIMINSVIYSEVMGDERSENSKTISTITASFIEPDNFENAMSALGLLHGGKVSKRFIRMIDWLESAIVKNRTHPSIRYAETSLSDPKNISLVISNTLDQSRGGKDIGLFVKALIKNLRKSDGGVLKDVYSLSVRFNIVGEYLLRKNETIDRSFFAFPLAFISNAMSIGQQSNVGSFVVGTLQDFECGKSEKIKILKNVLSELSRDIFDKKLYQVINNNIEATKQESLKSAKAAIMGRNMSHNIGSHVLYYLKGHLGSVTQMVRDHIVLNDIQYRIIKNGNEEFVEILENSKSLNSIELPFLKGVGRFLTYLQERQDFIATIASSYHPSMVSVNFKDFIVDNFMPDKRAERHGSELKREKNILLQYLTKSEGISVEVYLNGKSLSSKSNINDSLRNIEVDVPGGVLGRQAFYSILENIVRNAAKHGKSNDGESLILNIEITDLGETYYKVKIIDNNEGSGKYYQLIDKMLDEDLIDNQHKLIEHHKGLKEIKISALWLVGVSLVDLQKEKRKDFIKIENSNGQLAYVFQLFKSQKLAILTDCELKLDCVNNSKSYHFFNVNNVQNDLSTIGKYSLVLNSTTQDIGGLRNQMKRYLQVTDDDQSKLFLEHESSEIYSTAYLAYLKKKFPELNTFQPLICTDKLETKGSNQELKIENNILLDWIQNNGTSFVKNSKGNPIYYKSFQAGRKRIAFKRHFKEQNELKNFFGDDFQPDKFLTYQEKKNHIRGLIKEALNHYYSIESITGDNSTVRILHNEEKNDEWILKCVETSLSKILILDERLWNNNCFYTPAKSNKYTNQVLELIEDQIRDHGVEAFDQEEFYKALALDTNVSEIREKELRDLVNNYNMDDIVDESNPYLYKEFKTDLEKIFLPETKERFNIYIPTSFELNGLSICNVKSHSAGQVLMMDLFRDPILSVRNILEPDRINIKYFNKGANFHYLSIHQGILDKIYNYYAELVEESGSVTSIGKEDYIPLVLKAFERDVNPDKLSIHSGRSRPYILPEGISFIPFSGIEYGIGESKQVLLNIILSAENDIKK